jgi:Ca-activated chloride channel homolog
MTFAAPWFLLGLLLVPVVLWLHFIREAKRERVVSALWLWGAEEAPERRARFNPNLLLLLQILAVLMGSIGAAAPRLEALGATRVLVIDSSAAMLAADLEGTRFEQAKRQASSLLGGRVAMIRAGLSATVLSPASASLEQHRASLDLLAAGDSSADLRGALDLGRSLLPKAEVHMFSSQAPFEGFRGVWHRVIGRGENIGITAFAIRGAQVFAALEGNLRQPKTVVISLERDGKPVARGEVRVPTQGRAVWTPKVKLEAGTYRATIQNQDALALDNEAFALISSARVLVTPPQDDVLRAVVSVPGVRAAARDVPPATARGYDVVVLVGAVPKALPEGNYLIFAPLPNRNQTPAISSVTRADSTDALLRFANLEGVRARVSSITPPELTGGTWQAIAFAGDKPFVLRGEAPGVRAVYIAAHPLETELRQFPAFPVLIYNILTEFTSATSAPLGSRLTGEVSLNGNAAPGLTRALLPGVYETPRQTLVANLASSPMTRLETGTSSVQTLGGNAGAASSQNNELETSPSSWRAPLILLALLALLLEAILRAGGFGGVISSVRSRFGGRRVA